MARNEARQWVRAEKRHETSPIEEGALEHNEQFLASISSLITNEQVIRQALEQVSAKHREALTLREVEDLSYEEISARLGTNLSTTKTWVRRGRQELAELLKQALTLPLTASGVMG